MGPVIARPPLPPGPYLVVGLARSGVAAALAAIRREPGRPWRPVTGVRTRPDGRFTAFTRVGPSQELRFVYYAFGDSRRGTRSSRLRVRVLPR